jgi:hypothetical protein
MKNLNGIKKWVDLKQGFEPNFSASKLSLFKNDLPMFICRYGFGKRQQPSASMHRGIIVEDAVCSVLTEKQTVDSAIEKAHARFNSLYFIPTPDVEKEFFNLDPMIRMSCEALKDYGKPEFPEDGKQEKIEFTLIDKIHEWEAPIIGFLDIVFPDKGVVVDLKTTTRMPSVQSYDHMLQRSIYQKAKGNYKVEFLYVTPKKYEFKEDGDPNELLEDARITINQMNNFCENLTPDQARKSLPIKDSFYWKGEEELKIFYNK